MRGVAPYSQFSQQESVVKGDLFQVVIAAAGAAVARLHIGHEQQRLLSVFSVRNLATYFAGSQYITWLSCRLVFTNIAG